MSHLIHFSSADSCVTHLRTLAPTLKDPLLKSQFAGFAAVAGVAVYELAIKDIFCNFANKKHGVFGAYVQAHFERINGKIKITAIKDDYIRKFGIKYLTRFVKLLDAKEKEILLQRRVSISASYTNLIGWRNEFAHEGRPPSNATLEEVCNAYDLGKEVINCIAATMIR